MSSSVSAREKLRKQDALLDRWCANSPIIPVVSIESLDCAVDFGKALYPVV